MGCVPVLHCTIFATDNHCKQNCNNFLFGHITDLQCNICFCFRTFSLACIYLSLLWNYNRYSITQRGTLCGVHGTALIKSNSSNYVGNRYELFYHELGYRRKQRPTIFNAEQRILAFWLVMIGDFTNKV